MCNMYRPPNTGGLYIMDQLGLDTMYTTTPDDFCACGVVPLTESGHLMIYGELTTYSVFKDQKFQELRY